MEKSALMGLAKRHTRTMVDKKRPTFSQLSRRAKG
jgi:hypothetical protein